MPNLLSVVLLVREGPLGRLVAIRIVFLSRFSAILLWNFVGNLHVGGRQLLRNMV